MPGVKASAPSTTAKLQPQWRVNVGDYVVAAEIASTGQYCAIGTGRGELVAADTQSGRELFRQAAHPQGVLGVAVSPSGACIATCGQDPHARLWSASGQLLRELPSDAAWVEQVAWSPSGALIAVGAGRTAKVFDASGALLAQSSALPSTVTGVAWRSDSSAVAVSCYGGVHIVPVSAQGKARQLEWKGSLISVAWSPDDKVIVCGTQDCSIHFWRLATGKDSEMSGYPSKVKALAWDRESSILATAGHASLTLWSFRGKGPERTKPLQLEFHQGVCSQLTFGPRSCVLASGAQDSSVAVWLPQQGVAPMRIGYMEAEVTALHFHPTERELLAGDAQGNLVMWEI